MAAGVLLLWWCAAPSSPLVARWNVDPLDFLPLATAFAAPAAGAFARLANRIGGVFRDDWGGDDARDVEVFGSAAGLTLALLATFMTRAQVNTTTVETLLVATSAPALAVWTRNSAFSGYATGLLGSLACSFAGLEAARRWGLTGEGDAWVAAAGGATVALGAVWAFAGLLRRRSAEGRLTEGLPVVTAAAAVEQAGAVVAVIAGVVVAGSTLVDPPPGSVMEAVAVVVLFALGLFGIGLIVRWKSEWLVYATQASLVGAYFYYRRAFPIPATADAVVLTAFGYLDLGLAEVMHRVGLDRFARPTRYVALALPLLPVALSIGGGSLAESRLLVLFAAATLYATACYSMQWKSLGYAAAVLYNAFLWILWGRFGWTAADHSALFLAPAGLSTVLFAEVNRGELGRSALNAIRGVGLSIVYFSLAFPIWRFGGLGAWATLLLVSLAGIFAGIGLRVQLFLWFGLTGFVLDVVYQLGRMGMESTLAKWAIMLALGLALVLFVALNEKRRIVASMREFIDEARQWE
jgi:hypothetical protein